MARPLVFAFLGLSLVAGCTVGDTGGSSGSPDASSGGDDSASGSDAPQTTPRVGLSSPTTTITTDLNVEQQLTVTATGMAGFSGAVTLSAAPVDAGGNAMLGWTATLDSTSVTLTADGSQTVGLKVKGLGNAPLTGGIKLTATSSAGTEEKTIPLTANPVVIVMFTSSAGQCVYPSFPVNNPLRITAGRIIKVVNGATVEGQNPTAMVIHVDGGIDGFPHESTGGETTAMGAAYPPNGGMLTSAADTGQFYCHNGVANTLSDGGSHPYLRVE